MQLTKITAPKEEKMSLWQTFNLAIGNDKRCRTKYRKQITWSTLTVYLLFFLGGMMASDFTINAEPRIWDVERGVNFISAAMVFSLGTNILWKCWKENDHHLLVPFIVITLMMGQAAFIFGLFVMPILHVIFHIISILTILLLYSLMFKK